eukprot:GHVP01049964.1.p1 GENE.GHVP01049964.1~~GHVP01049964.1.p1  ORF type:complete len:449 (+),score=80.60 GHVP01049964.1:2084-3430(+)
MNPYSPLMDSKTRSPFTTLSLSKTTQKTLEDLGYTKMTTIQEKSLEKALSGKDLLISAKTGTGKTLCYILPIIEALVKQNWNTLDGVGGIILTPTQELATQSFEVLKKVASESSLVVGLILGGKRRKEESRVVCQMNIIVSTPGNLLYNLDTAPDLNTDNLRILVFDEADKLFDNSSNNKIDSILQHLSKEHQKLLFAATKSASIESYSQVSMNSPEYITDDQNSLKKIPDNIEQRYILCKHSDKFDLLYALTKRSRKRKSIFFFSTPKQTSFFYELFKHLFPGLSILQINGKQGRKERLETCIAFSQRRYCVLFATDIVSRGLDFSNIDTIVQVDLPYTVEDYIHRIGRSGRLDTKGGSILIVDEKNSEILEELDSTGISITKRKTSSVLKDLDRTSINGKVKEVYQNNPDIKKLAIEALSSYLKAEEKRGKIIEEKEELEKSIGLK